ncbi:hypothetical protein MGYG_05777 [Nannizzia gypsea CBS 118893]|uniref:Uncharacterized protein n=1 Tax=Arthroderma gypseum (strain ATCC MYA-4604 / CBS 118893) TaxID=535722 RepID=E4UXU6_ARTGP|nr:hypothetical protein MGYG_05777 [Nannizzia gypsea CBS 118893]EFR02778.1 hypothetical protein MGYG_05777 [Nannizzia gypsea CBS 118893]
MALTIPSGARGADLATENILPSQQLSATTTTTTTTKTTTPDAAPQKASRQTSHHPDSQGQSQSQRQSAGEDAREDISQEEEQEQPPKTNTPRPKPLSTMAGRPVSPLPLGSLSPSRASVSPHRARHAYMTPTSPSRQLSPHSQMHSPASSQIFERDVQEDFPVQTSPAIPSHIVTENHIPPILEASSAALTDERLDPDSVEIVTHTLHQPASAVVAAGTTTAPSSAHPGAVASSFHEHAYYPQSPCDPETASTYGTGLDSADIRRLSFVSFADLVHGEQVESYEHAANRDSQIMGGLAALANAPAMNNTSNYNNRSPSPMRSPISSHGPGSSPPTSVSPGEPRCLETSSPGRGARVPCSPPPCPHSPSAMLSSDLNVETMRQALRRTGSGDLGSMRHPPLSAAASDTAYERPFK